MKEYKFFTCKIENRIAQVIYERPPVNAMNGEAYGEMAKVFEEISNEKGVRCVVLRTKGKGFIGGNDVDEIAAHTRENHSAYQEVVGAAVMAVKNCKIPVIAMVQGYAIGSGMLIALACDLVVAGEKAWFALPEISLGIVAGMSFAMNDLPEKLVHYMCLTGNRVSAKELWNHGAVNLVTNAEELEQKTLEIAGKVAGQPPRTVKSYKECVKKEYNRRSEEFFRMETAYTRKLLETDEKKECLQAFYEKRTAVFPD